MEGHFYIKKQHRCALWVSPSGGIFTHFLMDFNPSKREVAVRERGKLVHCSVDLNSVFKDILNTERKQHRDPA